MAPKSTPEAHLIGFPKREPEPSPEELLQGFIYACEAEGKTAATVASYAENVRYFLRAARRLGLPEHPADIERQHILQLLSDPRREGGPRHGAPPLGEARAAIAADAR